MNTFQSLISPLLKSLQWKGEHRHLQEATPPGGIHNAHDLQDAMAHLGYASKIMKLKEVDITEISMPAIGIERDGSPLILESLKDLRNLSSHAKVMNFKPSEMQKIQTAGIAERLKKFKPLLGQVLVISLAINFMTMFPILYNRVIYDHIISSGTSEGMIMMVNGVLLALLLEMGLRHLRNTRLSFFGARIDHIVGCSALERLLFLSPSLTEKASVSAQIARMKDFESVRDFFTGPLASLFFEIPLILVYLTVMAFMAGWLTLVPVVTLLAFCILIYSMLGTFKAASKASSTAVTQRQEFILEAVSKMRDIRLAGMEDIWQDRYRALSGTASITSFRMAYKAQKLETISYILMTTGGIATLGFGVAAVLNNAVSIGGLIASMMLIWRILAPVQICCASLTRLQQLASSGKQVQKLLTLPPEHDPYSTPSPSLKLDGTITFHRVTMRYSADTEPAVLGLSFEARPGEIVAIKGNNGSGKSTILKLLLGLYQPQAGSVRLDGIDIRQFDPVTLRQSLSYIPQSSDMFPGTIRDNLLFSKPDATEAECLDALRDACALEDVQSLPKGLDTIIEGDGNSPISFLLRQRISLARAYMRPTKIMLFDEASYSLGPENDEAFIRKISSLRGQSTIILVTHREDHMRLADKLFIMNKGELTHAGAPDQVLTAIQGRRAS